LLQAKRENSLPQGPILKEQDMNKTTVRVVRVGVTSLEDPFKGSPHGRQRIIKRVCDRLVGDLDLSLQEARKLCSSLSPGSR